MRRVGVLEFGGAGGGHRPTDVLRDLVDRVRAYDRWGFHRVWFGEHHSPSFSWNFPDPLVASLAAATTRIRLGTGCALLKYREPYRLAADFRLLASLHPGRIELGVGSGVASETSAAVLRAGDGAAGYQQRVHDLVDFLHAGSTTVEPHRDIYPAPVGGGLPDLWVLGSTADSARLAGHTGANFCYALFTPSTERKPEVIETFYDAALRPDAQRHAVAAAAAWYVDRAELERAPALDDYPGFAKLSFSGPLDDLPAWLDSVAERYADPELVLLDSAISAAPASRRWEPLAQRLHTAIAETSAARS